MANEWATCIGIVLMIGFMGLVTWYARKARTKIEQSQRKKEFIKRGIKIFKDKWTDKQ